MHDKMKSRSRRAIPAVNTILESLGETAGPAQTDLPRPLVVDLVRRELAQIRKKGRQIPDANAIVDLVRAAIDDLRASRIQPIINGTGVVVHTNLGRSPLAHGTGLFFHTNLVRSPLAQGAGETLRGIASAYNNIELDLEMGGRGQRGAYL